MNILLIGSGARESAMAWKFSQSSRLTKLWIWPGDTALSLNYASPDLPKGADWLQLAEWCVAQKISLVVSGPEAPLAAGAADIFQRQTNIPFFGPTQSLARLESSKSFSKEMMKAAGILTADFTIAHNRESCARFASEYFAKWGKVVLKASGLAAGKGVFVCHKAEEIEEGLNHLYGTEMASAAAEVVVEQCLEGRECSYFTMITANKPRFLGFAVDYKRLQDGDQGPNTGGMGTYTSVPWLPVGAEELITDTVVTPLLDSIARGGESYTGYLYVGIMWTKEGPYVLEFNVRLGDPEAQVLAVQDQRDWLAMIASDLGISSGPSTSRDSVGASSLDTEFPALSSRYTVGVVAASPNYPFGDSKEARETVLSRSLFEGCGKDLQIFGASLKPVADGLKTGSGRVLTVVAAGDSMTDARNKAYHKIAQIRKVWPFLHCRTDVADLGS
jgi:phosphoribosylamine---glycine ligase